MKTETVKCDVCGESAPYLADVGCQQCLACYASALAHGGQYDIEGECACAAMEGFGTLTAAMSWSGAEWATVKKAIAPYFRA